MEARLINRIKNNRILHFLVIKIYKIFWSFLSFFIKTDERKIIFSSYGGRKFDDSPYALYCALKKDPFFKGYKFVWAFNDVEKFDVSEDLKVKIDSFKFFKELLSSKIWISNSGIDRGIGLNKKDIIRIETWHGTPIKKICGEENSCSVKTKRRKKIDAKTIRCAQSEYDRKIFSRVFNAPESSLLICDLPRNDSLLLKPNAEKIKEIKTKIGIPLDKKIILYMPTYREYLNTNKYDNYIAPPIDLTKWEKELGSEYFLIFRAHYVVTKIMNIKNNNFVFDASNYDKINDLYQISDMLISDYSSSFFDFSLTDKPMLCFAYDFDEYAKKRGLYLDIKNDLHLDIFDKEDLMLDVIKEKKVSTEGTSIIKKKFVPYAGNSCYQIIEKIKTML